MQRNDLNETKTRIEWKVLESLVDSGHLSIVDLELAKVLLGNLEDADTAALICHLSLSARRGHLCVDISKGKITPDVLSLWKESRLVEKEAPIEDSMEGLLSQIEIAIIHAAENLPERLLTCIHSTEINSQMHEIQTPLCRMGSRIYFQRYWYYETLFIYNYQRFISIPPKIILSQEALDAKLLESGAVNSLMPEQKDAILKACMNSLTIICGGPGTGKTHTAGVLICTLWNSLSESEREKFEISLAAPTGKAAANLQKSLLKSAKGIGKLSTLQSKTLHALLGFKSSTPLEEVYSLSADLVIVDESSMIDVKLMAGLFAAMKPGARLILLGDEHQLAAVEAGSIFADFVHAHEYLSTQRRSLPNLQVSKLNKCLRSELQGILDVAEAINRGDADAALQLFDQAESKGIQRLKLTAPHQCDAAVARELALYAFNCFQLDKLGLNHALTESGVQSKRASGSSQACPSEIRSLSSIELASSMECASSALPLNHKFSQAPPYGSLPGVDPLTILNHFNRFRILSPLRKGPYGVEEINRLISNAYRLALGKRGSTSYIVPIMLLKNDYRLELFNGEVGVLVKPHYRYGQTDFELSKGDYALFAGKEEQVRQIPALLLPTFEYAYCLSVHKSQGSEFDHLLLVLPSGSEHFGRELLYTGVTRARRQLTIWGEDDILRRAIQLKNHRLSGITERLTQVQ